MVIRMRADGKTIIFLRAPRGWCRGTSLVFLLRATTLISCPLQQQQLVLIWASFLIILLDIHLSYSLINFLSHGVFTFLLIFLLHLHVSCLYVGIFFHSGKSVGPSRQVRKYSASLILLLNRNSAQKFSAADFVKHLCLMYLWCLIDIICGALTEP